MRVAVTGGSGFIGQATVRELIAAGHQPVILDAVAPPVDDLAPAYPLDVREPDDVNGHLFGCDAVIHLAGLLGTDELFDNALAAVDVNVKGAVNVLEAARQLDLRFVGITMLQVWENVYQATKNCADRLASAWHRHYGVPVSHVRAFNGYGPGQAYGPGHPRKILPVFAAAAWNRVPIPVWGDGEQTVDLVHVDDIGRMLVDCLLLGSDELVDAGTGKAVTVNEVARFVNEIAGSTAGIDYRPMRRGEHDVDNLVAEGAGWDRLDWKPELDWDRVAETVRAYRGAGWYG